ncbi:MAG: hypothetical protein ACFCUI_07320 [Bernardetiaceae bacterium]
MNADQQRLLDPDIQDFLCGSHLPEPTELLLHPHRYPSTWPLPLIAEQIKARQKAQKKLPSWWATPGVLFPDALSVEQSSSEATAAFKQTLCPAAETLVDLTGGLGVDTFFLAQRFQKTHYVEQNPTKAALAAHNFQQLGATNITAHAMSAEDFLRRPRERDTFFYLDPSRRAPDGRRVFLLPDCSPNIVQLQGQLLRQGIGILLKTAPLLDIAQALQHLQHVRRVCVLAHQDECKEVLYELHPESSESIDLQAVHLKKDGRIDTFTTTWEAEKSLPLLRSDPRAYLYFPHPALMKAGCFRSVSAQYQLPQLHAHTHVYTSDDMIPDFPGKAFVCLSVQPFDRKRIKQQWRNRSATLLVRNFPTSVDRLRQTLQIRDGGEDFLLFTTLQDEKRAVLHLQKIKS